VTEQRTGNRRRRRFRWRRIVRRVSVTCCLTSVA
jgi:hypothetical protein